MRPSEDCIQIKKRLERYMPNPYLCPAGAPTIGYGCTRYADGRKVTLADAPMSEPSADTLLRAIMAQMWGGAQGMIRVPLRQGQVDALALLVANIGETEFRASTLLRKLNAGDFDGAAREFPRWNKVTVDGVKRAINGLVTRRKLERRIFEKG